ncbi:MAG: YdeI/OmpD-associated family protein [Candidatus Promineifilaceae bacterium]|jgi:uncharacterized protein YdeI (YjbR/CyaY-like superfamily)
MDNKDQVEVESRAQWRAWLAANHGREDGVWLVRFKKHTGDKYVSYDDAVEEALCFGWVDSLPRKLDADRSMLWMAPRRPGSNWSAANKERVERLAADGWMAPAGLAKVEAAQADGTWNALDSVDKLEVPGDLAAAFERYPGSAVNFEAFPASTRRAILEWILSAKRPATREKRIEETARLAQENIRANQWRR